MKKFDHDIKAVCTWGESYDVTIDAPNFPVFIFSEPDKNHNVQSWQLGLNIKQAKKLVDELNVSIARAEELDETFARHDHSVEDRTLNQVRNTKEKKKSWETTVDTDLGTNKVVVHSLGYLLDVYG